MERYLDIKELSEILGIKTSTIYGWVHEGYIPHIKFRRLVRFKESQILEWLKDKDREGRTSRIPRLVLDNGRGGV